MSFPSVAGRTRGLRRAAVAAAAAVGLLAAGTALAGYVVVTVDNKVYEVPTKPEVRGDLVFFSLDGVPVSLRAYEVNVAKTNEFNNLVDRGGDMVAVVERAKSLRPALPTDERLIVSSPLHQQALAASQEASPATRAARSSSKSAYSFSGESSTAQKPPKSEFESEAREALAEAKRKVREEKEPAPARSDADSGRAADLDAEIAAEQEYLRKLTSGEVTVEDLDREISRSMDKIAKLQNRRSKVGGDAEPARPARESAPAYEFSGKYPEGTRGARLERELQQAMDKLERLKAQQASASGDPDERVMNEELIGETQYRIDKLQKKLAGIGSDGS